MKKRRLKKWVVWLLRTLFILALLLGASDCENMKIFIISHLIAIVVVALTGYILIKNMEVENEN